MSLLQTSREASQKITELQSEISQKDSLIAKLSEENERLNEHIKNLSNADLKLKQSEKIKKEAETLMSQANDKEDRLCKEKADLEEKKIEIRDREYELSQKERDFNNKVSEQAEEKIKDEKEWLKSQTEREHRQWEKEKTREHEQWEKEKNKEYKILYAKITVPFIFLGVVVLLLAGICILNVYPDRIIAITDGLSEIGNGIVAFFSLFPMLFSWLCGLFSSDWFFIFPWKDIVFALLVYAGIPVGIFFLCRSFLPKLEKIDFEDNMHRYKWNVSFASLAILPFFLSLYLSDNIGLMSWLTWYLIMTLPLLIAFYCKTRTKML